MHDGRAARAYVARMFSISALATHLRIVQVMTLVLLTAIVLLAVGVTGSDEAHAGMRCAVSGRC